MPFLIYSSYDQSLSILRKAVEMNQKTFLLQLVIQAYNFQFRTKHNYKDFDLKPLTNNQNSSCSFEIFSNEPTDYFRIRAYFSLDSQVTLSTFRVDETKNSKTGDPGTEVVVVTGTLDESFYNFSSNSIHRGCPTLSDLSQTTYVAGTDQVVYTLADGSYIQLR